MQVTDGADGKAPISRFAIAVTQKLCFFANSSACVETDPEFRRVAGAFETGGFNFVNLVNDFFSSPLVTGASDTLTFDQLGMTVSVSRRDQLCASLSNRLERPRHLRAAGDDPDHRAGGDREDRDQRRGRRLQPRLGVAGHAVRADGVLPRRHRDAVRERGRAGGRLDGRARSTAAPTSPARSRT